ncbi:D-alanyl-D-alanine carboxypeptidase DacC [Paraburkholderia kirstenboschensis]|uniref:D-alanyl-D-alanine carboxypeptidase family protein n=1 Tax=Paraburkholderia kirstenboschensis TaxID=1245436 RepID=UPI000ADDCC24|nr:D-alanyl-D-alanine carboxypeptidase family protein [Paraburkholderia kirstenboschensis]CAD6560003.1 D-alanyl-D-alanine carboxypeptidase DacC [Paraburkholderia kirstenboschensis]
MTLCKPLRKRYVFLASLCSIALLSNRVSAQTAPPAVNARAWVLLDSSSNQILASQNAEARMEPASLTKIMTAYLVFQALQDNKIRMDETVLPSDAVRSVGKDESRMFIEPNKPVSVHDLLYGLIVESGNDAAIALAEVVGGTQSHFVDMMNAQAQAIGMSHTHFADVNGMPEPNHYTTAGDLAILAMRLIHDFPQDYPIFSVRTFSYDNIRQLNRNRLLWLDPTVDGLKTGHTDAAGYCLIASALRPVRGAPGKTRRVLSVVMGDRTGSDRVRDSLRMLDFAYDAFEEVVFYKAGQAVETSRLYEGTALSVRVGVAKDLVLTVPVGQDRGVKPKVSIVLPLVAPLAADQKVGKVELVSTDGRVLAQAPLVVLDAVPQAGLLARAWDFMLLHLNRPG